MYCYINKFTNPLGLNEEDKNAQHHTAFLFLVCIKPSRNSPKRKTQDPEGIYKTLSFMCCSWSARRVNNLSLPISVENVSIGEKEKPFPLGILVYPVQIEQNTHETWQISKGYTGSNHFSHPQNYHSTDFHLQSRRVIPWVTVWGWKKRKVCSPLWSTERWLWGARPNATVVKIYRNKEKIVS